MNTPQEPNRKQMTETELLRWASEQLGSNDPEKVKAFVLAWNKNPESPFLIDISEKFAIEPKEKGKVILLETALPCACGAPAHVASAFFAGDLGLDFQHGWVIYPTCANCTRKMQQAYSLLDKEK